MVSGHSMGELMVSGQWSLYGRVKGEWSLPATIKSIVRLMVRVQK